MRKKFSVIGGDLRISELATMLANDGNEVRVYGMEKSNKVTEDTKIIKCDNLEDAIGMSDIIIGSVPFSKNNKEMYATFSDKDIPIKELIKEEHKDKIFFAGSFSENAKNQLLKSYGKVFDVMQREELAVLNAIATAEGAVDIAINNTDKTIHGSKVLVLGFGRVGKVVARKFQSLSAEVTCAARKQADLAWIHTFGYEVANINTLKENLTEYDIIINTVPHIVISKTKMKYMKKDVLLIDLASDPGGIDRNDAKEMNLKFVWALALPGKVAPVTSAGIIKQTMYNILEE